MTTGSWIGLGLGLVAYWVLHGFFAYCVWGDACWAEMPVWGGVGALVGGFAESLYENRTGKNL
jgi:hypothetical protein